jgi:cytochrome c-type biogenesis protein CcmH/NrfG
MIGWLIFVAIAAAALAALWRFAELGRDVWTFVFAAVMLGAAGYAWQGRPGQPGYPVAAAGRTIEVDPELTMLRGAMTERFGASAQWLVPADALLRSGATRTSIAFIKSGLNENPNSVTLWTALGGALVEHDGGNVSPTARFAFEHAAGLVPDNPAPWFFLGLAEVRAGEFDAAEKNWSRALALTDADAPYRDDVAVRLTLLRRFIAIREARIKGGGEMNSPPPAGER